MCARGVHFSHDVYLVRTTGEQQDLICLNWCVIETVYSYDTYSGPLTAESGFVGVVNAAPEDVHHLFQETLGISLGPSTPPDGTGQLTRRVGAVGVPYHSHLP